MLGRITVNGSGGIVASLSIYFLLICAFVAVSVSDEIRANDRQPVFSTGETLELDRVASAWLIKRYVEKDAVFRFFPDGRIITDGTAFDTADAALQRNHKQSTFEVILHRYDITDPRLAGLTKIIHQNEINYWAGSETSQGAAFVRKINDIIKTSADNEACLQQCFAFFDQFIEERNFTHVQNK